MVNRLDENISTWTEMSYYKYKPLNQRDRLRLEYDIENKRFEEEKRVSEWINDNDEFVWGEF